MDKKLFFIPDLCTGCNRCVYICSAVKEEKFIPSKARIHINNFPTSGYSVSSICFQCPKPECQQSCLEDAIYKDKEDIVLIDHDRCNGCGECVAACPYGMIDQDEMGFAYKCDYCGGEPVCVSQCFFNALAYTETDKTMRKLRGVQMKQRIQTGTPTEKRHQLGMQVMAIARESRKQ